jgi:hypothetical protein
MPRKRCTSFKETLAEVLNFKLSGTEASLLFLFL